LEGGGWKNAFGELGGMFGGRRVKNVFGELGGMFGGRRVEVMVWFYGVNNI